LRGTAVAGHHVFHRVEASQVRGIDFVDFARDQAIAHKEAWVTPHVDQAAGHLGWAHKTSALHLGL
jgi:hypothetical protein